MSEQELAKQLVEGGPSDFKFSGKIPQAELNDWLQYYMPPKSVPKDGLMVDVGAREGDTAVFYALQGYRNLRLVEPWDQYWENLDHNVAILRAMGCLVDVRKEAAKQEHFEGAAFVKFDCEGCELAFDITKLPCPAVMELHVKTEPMPNNRGTFNYARNLGYLTWMPEHLTEHKRAD